VEQLSRSDARVDGDDTVSIDGSSNGTVPDYPHGLSNRRDDLEPKTVSAGERVPSGFDVKQVFHLDFKP